MFANKCVWRCIGCMVVFECVWVCKIHTKDNHTDQDPAGLVLGPQSESNNKKGETTSNRTNVFYSHWWQNLQLPASKAIPNVNSPQFNTEPSHEPPVSRPVVPDWSAALRGRAALIAEEHCLIASLVTPFAGRLYTCLQLLNLENSSHLITTSMMMGQERETYTYL